MKGEYHRGHPMARHSILYDARTYTGGGGERIQEHQSVSCETMVVGTPAKKIVFVDTCLVPAKILRKRLSDRLGSHKL